MIKPPRSRLPIHAFKPASKQLLYPLKLLPVEPLTPPPVRHPPPQRVPYDPEHLVRNSNYRILAAMPPTRPLTEHPHLSVVRRSRLGRLHRPDETMVEVRLHMQLKQEHRPFLPLSLAPISAPLGRRLIPKRLTRRTRIRLDEARILDNPLRSLKLFAFSCLCSSAQTYLSFPVSASRSLSYQTFE